MFLTTTLVLWSLATIPFILAVFYQIKKKPSSFVFINTWEYKFYLILNCNSTELTHLEHLLYRTQTKTKKGIF